MTSCCTLQMQDSEINHTQRGKRKLNSVNKRDFCTPATACPEGTNNDSARYGYVKIEDREQKNKETPGLFYLKTVNLPSELQDSLKLFYKSM